MSKSGTANAQPAQGKLGVMVVGMGAVATTLIAGVEATRKGLAKPIGSLTQMGTIRLGKRTENRTPLIKDFVPLASLEDIVFTGWEIFPDNMYEAAAHARHTGACRSLADRSPAASLFLRSTGMGQAQQIAARQSHPVRGAITGIKQQRAEWNRPTH